MTTLTQVRRKLNDFFFADDEPHWSDEMWFYGVMAFGALVVCFIAAYV